VIALVEAHRVGLLSRAHWRNNLAAGLVVGVVALPLAMAFAIASGATPQQGLYTAIIAGFLTSVLGGSRLQISGPTGAFIVILAGISAKYGIQGLQIATLMAGVMLLGMGVARLGGVIKYIPHPVIIGFTTGIAIIIWVGQWQYFFGLAPAHSGEHFHEKLAALLYALPLMHLPTTALGVLALLIAVFSPRLLPKLPAPLVAMVVVTTLQSLFKFEGIATIGSAFGEIPRELPQFRWLDFGLSDVVRLVGPAFTIALLGAIESLLSAVVADGMAGTRHDPNQELIGQGIANIAAPLFGGFAATGAIARTATNVRNGATGPLAGIVHAATLLLIILIAAPLASDIPLCALAAILFVVAWNMAELQHFVRLIRIAPRADVAILLITFGLTVLADLVIAVNVGVILASLLFMHRMAESVEVQDESESHAAVGPAGHGNRRSGGRALVYSIDGPFFFGAAEKLQTTLSTIRDPARAVLLRMGRVPFMDATGLEALSELIDDFQRSGAQVCLCELRPNVAAKLERAGIVAKIGAANVHADLAAWRAAMSADAQNGK
jgi:SulP family sulfate permease